MWKDKAYAAALNHIGRAEGMELKSSARFEYLLALEDLKDVPGWREADKKREDQGDRRGDQTGGAGENRNGECHVPSWTDIVAISAGANHTIGLKSDGTVIAAGNNMEGQCNVDDWTDIKLPNHVTEK